MKYLPIVIVTALLAGCGTVEQMSYGSWLDQVGKRHAAKYPFTPEETEALRARAAQLQTEGDAVRMKLAAETDRTRRIAYLSQLEDIGDDLRPVQKELRQGGTDSRRYPPPPNYVQGGGS